MELECNFLGSFSCLLLGRGSHMFSSVAGRLPVKAEKKKHEQAHLHPLALVCKGRHAVFPVPRQQDTSVFGAQGILSSCAATDIVVFVASAR
jgi:hypothetical protein